MRMHVMGTLSCCSLLQYVALCCSVLRCVAVRCSVLQCVAVRCDVLQCVAVCCSVLHEMGAFLFIRPLVPTNALLHLPCAFCVAATVCRYKGMSGVHVLRRSNSVSVQGHVQRARCLSWLLVICSPLSAPFSCSVSACASYEFATMYSTLNFKCNTLQHTASHCIALQHTT